MKFASNNMSNLCTIDSGSREKAGKTSKRKKIFSPRKLIGLLIEENILEDKKVFS